VLARAESVGLADVVEGACCFAAHAEIVAAGAGGAGFVVVVWGGVGGYGVAVGEVAGFVL